MSWRVTWTGLEEFKAALRNLPRALTGEARDIVEDAAREAERDAFTHYPEGGTGHLRAGLAVRPKHSNTFGASVYLINRAPHAHFYEEGTAVRNYRGANRGQMPAQHVFVPAAMRARARMWDRLRDMVEGHGLKVTGESSRSVTSSML